MAEYEKPQIKSPGCYSEPVESGCCLRSCGGSPGGSQSSKVLAKEARSVEKILEETDI